MGKFDGILLCSDLDDTLLDSEKIVSQKSIDAIEYFKNEGGIFTFITGRHHLGINGVLRQVQPNTIIGCLNGCSLYDHILQKTIMEVELSNRYVEVLDFITENFEHIGFEVMTHQKVWICKENPLITRHITLEHLTRYECDYRDVPGKLGKVLLVGETEKIDELIPAIEKLGYADTFDFVRSSTHYYEILPKGANKGNLLKEIARYNGIDMSRTIAAGDNDNDLQMLQYAGCGFAVANATDNAKKAADRITVSNTQSAIAQIIDDIDNGLIF